MLKMGFDQALKALKSGMCVQRLGWNGKGMYLYLVNGSQFEVNREPLSRHLPMGTVVNYRPHIDMRAADGSFVPWLASQSDLLEEDWVVCNPPDTNQIELPIG